LYIVHVMNSQVSGQCFYTIPIDMQTNENFGIK